MKQTERESRRAAIRARWRVVLDGFVEEHGIPVVAGLLDVDERTLRDYRSGKRFPEPEVLAPACRALGISVESILYGEEATGELEERLATAVVAALQASGDVTHGDGGRFVSGRHLVAACVQLARASLHEVRTHWEEVSDARAVKNLVREVQAQWKKWLSPNAGDIAERMSARLADRMRTASEPVRLFGIVQERASLVAKLRQSSDGAVPYAVDGAPGLVPLMLPPKRRATRVR